MSIPPLEDRLLHLHTPSGAKSGYVILLGKNNQQVGGIFDMQDEGSKKDLESAYKYEYTDDERGFVDGIIKEYAERKTITVPESEYSGPVAHNGEIFNSSEELKQQNKVIDGLLVYAVEEVRCTRMTADDVWQFTTLSLESNEEPDIQSKIKLDRALNEFYSANTNKLVKFTINPTVKVQLNA